MCRVARGRSFAAARREAAEPGSTAPSRHLAHQPLEHAGELVDREIHVLHHAPVEHRGRHVSTFELLLKDRDLPENDALDPRQTVAYVGQTIEVMARRTFAAAFERLRVRNKRPTLGRHAHEIVRRDVQSADPLDGVATADGVNPKNVTVSPKRVMRARLLA